MFSQVCVKNSVHSWSVHGCGNAWHGGMCGRGHVWQGACVAGGMCGMGACVAGGMCGRGHVWQGAWQGVWQRACMVGGMHGRRDGHCSGRYASYWNAFLLGFRLQLLQYQLFSIALRSSTCWCNLVPGNQIALLAYCEIQGFYCTGKFDYFLSNNATVKSRMLHQLLT